jgi:hypothetical protein
MEDLEQALGESALPHLDYEFGLVLAAVTMVASGGARRILFASLRYGAQLLELARDQARGAGVRITPIWALDDEHVGLAIDRAVDA